MYAIVKDNISFKRNFIEVFQIWMTIFFGIEIVHVRRNKKEKGEQTREGEKKTRSRKEEILVYATDRF